MSWLISWFRTIIAYFAGRSTGQAAEIKADEDAALRTAQKQLKDAADTSTDPATVRREL